MKSFRIHFLSISPISISESYTSTHTSNYESYGTFQLSESITLSFISGYLKCSFLYLKMIITVLIPIYLSKQFMCHLLKKPPDGLDGLDIHFCAFIALKCFIAILMLFMFYWNNLFTQFSLPSLWAPSGKQILQVMKYTVPSI